MCVQFIQPIWHAFWETALYFWMNSFTAISLCCTALWPKKNVCSLDPDIVPWLCVIMWTICNIVQVIHITSLILYYIPNMSVYTRWNDSSNLLFDFVQNRPTTCSCLWLQSMVGQLFPVCHGPSLLTLASLSQLNCVTPLPWLQLFACRRDYRTWVNPKDVRCTVKMSMPRNAHRHTQGNCHPGACLLICYVGMLSLGLHLHCQWEKYSFTYIMYFWPTVLKIFWGLSLSCVYVCAKSSKPRTYSRANQRRRYLPPHPKRRNEEEEMGEHSGDNRGQSTHPNGIPCRIAGRGRACPKTTPPWGGTSENIRRPHFFLKGTRQKQTCHQGVALTHQWTHSFQLPTSWHPDISSGSFSDRLFRSWIQKFPLCASTLGLEWRLNLESNAGGLLAPDDALCRLLHINKQTADALMSAQIGTRVRWVFDSFF